MSQLRATKFDYVLASSRQYALITVEIRRKRIVAVRTSAKVITSQLLFCFALFHDFLPVFAAVKTICKKSGKTSDTLKIMCYVSCKYIPIMSELFMSVFFSFLLKTCLCKELDDEIVGCKNFINIYDRKVYVSLLLLVSTLLLSYCLVKNDVIIHAMDLIVFFLSNAQIYLNNIQHSLVHTFDKIKKRRKCDTKIMKFTLLSLSQNKILFSRLIIDTLR